MYYPPFCPNPNCTNHHEVPRKNKYSWFAKDGFYSSCLLGKTQRYKCKQCKIRFSKQTFSLDYYAKKKIRYQNLLKELVSTSNLSDMSRRFGVSHNTISNKIRRLSRQALGVNSHLRQHISLHEPFVADGFEGVAVNFYYPNNVNIMMGKNSLFFYVFNYTTIKRTGKLTEKQRADRDYYESIWKADTKGVKHSFNRLVEDLAQLDFIDHDIFPMVLFTDKKLEYKRALRGNRFFRTLSEGELFYHFTISSKEPRTLENPLFPVNYMDRQFRKDIAEHVTKSICFAKNVNNQMERMHIYQFYHNYIKKNRVREKRYLTHSTLAGIPNSLRKSYLNLFFTERVFVSHLNLDRAEVACWNRGYVTPLRLQEEHLPAYLSPLPALLYEDWCA